MSRRSVDLCSFSAPSLALPVPPCRRSGRARAAQNHDWSSADPSPRRGRSRTGSEARRLGRERSPPGAAILSPGGYPVVWRSARCRYLEAGSLEPPGGISCPECGASAMYGCGPRHRRPPRDQFVPSLGDRHRDTSRRDDNPVTCALRGLRPVMTVLSVPHPYSPLLPQPH